MLSESTTTLSVPAAVTFDIGGTLLFPDPGVGEVYAEVLAEHGIQKNPRDLNTGFRRAWKAVLSKYGEATDDDRERRKWRNVVRRTLGDSVPDDRFEAVFDDLWKTFAEARRWRVRDNTRRVLADLRNRGIRTAVLSNWDKRLRPLLDSLELSDLFDVFFISSEVGWRKPDLRIFQAAERGLDLAPARILHVGDHAREDVAAARAAGWQAAWIREDGESGEGDVPAITDLRQLLERLGSTESD